MNTYKLKFKSHAGEVFNWERKGPNMEKCLANSKIEFQNLTGALPVSSTIFSK